jgi:hypothetical protein
VGDDLPKPGDTIGVRYEIEHLLGQEGMGAVFAATNRATGRAVAIKWMLPSVARSREAVERFLVEARATARIEHPNVIGVLDVGQDGDAPFLVVERLRGESLGDRLARGRLGVRETLAVLVAACRGVAEAHGEGIVHRDLKPDNIFLCTGKDGSPREPKVLDFGISKLYEAGPGGKSLTHTGVAMGTPSYMSPEMLSAPGQPDPRFDVYAMGVVAYECLTGRLPYDADGLFERVQQIAAGSPPSIRDLAPDVPPQLEQIVLRAMHRDIRMRHGSMRELLADLEAVRAQVGGGLPRVPSSAPGFGAVPATGPFTPVGGEAVARAAGGVGAPSGWATPPPTVAATAGAPGPPAPSRRSGMSAGAIIAIAAVIAGVGIVGLGLLGVGVVYVSMRAGEAPAMPTPAVGGGPVVETPSVGGGAPAPEGADPVALTFRGACAPDFGGGTMRTVLGSGGNVIVSAMGPGGNHVLTFQNLPTGVTRLSTAQRRQTQTIVMLVSGGTTFMNLSTQAMMGGVDQVGGTLEVRAFNPQTSTIDVTLTDVTLPDVQGRGVCTLNGTARHGV